MLILQHFMQTASALPAAGQIPVQFLHFLPSHTLNENFFLSKRGFLFHWKGFSPIPGH